MTHGMLRRSPTALVRRCPDRVLVLVDDSVHSLAGAGIDIWTMLEQPATTADIVRAVRDVYGDGHVAEDVESFLEQLLDVDVLVRCPGPGS